MARRRRETREYERAARAASRARRQRGGRGRESAPSARGSTSTNNEEIQNLYAQVRNSSLSREDRNSARQQIEQLRQINEQEQRAAQWDERQAFRHSQYDRQYGAGAHRDNVRMMEAYARRRAADEDYIQRAQSGEVDFEGDPESLDEIRTGRAWDPGQIAAYEDYTANRLEYKKNPQAFDYDSYFPNDPRRSRRKPTYEQFMGQYYDPSYVHRGGNGMARNWQYGSQPQQYGNPFR